MVVVMLGILLGGRLQHGLAPSDLQAMIRVVRQLAIVGLLRCGAGPFAKNRLQLNATQFA
jgi:hypothetical protein